MTNKTAQTAYSTKCGSTIVPNVQVQVDPSLSLIQNESTKVSTSNHTLVNTAEDMRLFLTCLPDILVASAEPSLYIDLEGVNLSRHGLISIIQIMVLRSRKVYLIDVLKLGSNAFTISCENGVSLRQILESDSIHKAFFDVRNDSDALHHHYGIRLQGVHDIQLMELAARPLNVSRKYVAGLAKCIEFNAGLSRAEMIAWKQTKDRGLGLFCPTHGGSYDVFTVRPLTLGILEYCVQDVLLLPRLWQSYDGKICAKGRPKVLDAAKRRVQESQSPAYVPHGRHKALAPIL